MSKGPLKQLIGRILHLMARFVPGSMSLRPSLHRLRGVKIGKNVFIGDEVYLENEYPEQVEIQDGVQISIRVTILAHTRGAGRIILEKDSYIGAHCVLVTSGGKVLRVGEGAVIGAGCVVTKDVPPHAFVNGEFGKMVAIARVPFSKADHMEDFIRGLEPVRRGPKTD
jgi:acetyltransferase-like isoleucine patch superfamily enzyme